MQRILLVAFAFAAFGGGTTAALAQDDCSWYALTSAKQQQENQTKGCGLAGDGWSTDIKVHTAWCETVPPDEWRKAVSDRQQELDSCGG